MGNKHTASLSWVCSLVHAFGEQFDSVQWKVHKSVNQQCLFLCVAKRETSHIVLQEICEGNSLCTVFVIVKKVEIAVPQEKNGQLSPSLTNIKLESTEIPTRVV